MMSWRISPEPETASLREGVQREAYRLFKRFSSFAVTLTRIELFWIGPYRPREAVVDAI